MHSDVPFVAMALTFAPCLFLQVFLASLDAHDHLFYFGTNTTFEGNIFLLMQLVAH